jgi:hypothetical protein
MENSKISIEDLVTLDGITVIAIAKVLQHSRHGDNCLQFYAAKEPAGVVVWRGASSKVYDRTGKEISLDDLANNFPEQAEYIEEKLNRF